MSAASLPPLKRGDSFLLCGVYAESGVAGLQGVLIDATVRDSSGAVVDTLDVVVVSPLAGQFELRKHDTRAWPVGVLLFDVRFSRAPYSATTETLRLPVVEPMTERQL